jgi:hypothetical protein
MMHTIEPLTSRRSALTFCLVLLAGRTLATTQASEGNALSFQFRDLRYVHRWTQASQYEFTPEGDSELTSWSDMITVNVFDAVRDGEALALVANQVLTNYQSAGKILRTDSRPRTPESPAEHFIAAYLGTAQFIEAVFARILLKEGTGYTVVYSHRIYGNRVGKEMSDWLRSNGPQSEASLMEWSGLPSNTVLKRASSRPR